MKFPLPENFVLPDGVQPGKNFDAVVTLSLGDSGDVTVVALDGTPISDAEEAVETADEVVAAEAAASSDSDFVNAVLTDMGAV